MPPPNFSPRRLKAFTGTKTVAASATPERLYPSDAYVATVLIMPASTSQNAFQIGDSVSQLVDGPLTLGSPQAGFINLKDVYVKVATNGDAVNFIAYYVEEA